MPSGAESVTVNSKSNEFVSSITVDSKTNQLLEVVINNQEIIIEQLQTSNSLLRELVNASQIQNDNFNLGFD